MSKALLCVDFGYDSFKIVQMNGKKIEHILVIPAPEDYFKDGRFTALESTAAYFKDALKKNGIHAKAAGVLLPSELIFMKNIIMPYMNTEMLRANLPYEFSGYITDDLKKYVYDYALVRRHADAEGSLNAASGEDAENEDKMELIGMAVSKEGLKQYEDFFAAVDLRLEMAASDVSSYMRIIRYAEGIETAPKKGESEHSNKEYCFLDLGYETIRMCIFVGNRFEVNRTFDMGMADVEKAVAEHYGVDRKKAGSYILDNYDNCLELEECRSVFGNIEIELARALNFYRFSNPESELNELYICGGGSYIKALTDAVREGVDLTVREGSELLKSSKDKELQNLCLQTIGLGLL